MKINWITDFEKIKQADFVSSWRKLLASAETHVFFTPELVQAWLETYRPIRNLQLCFLQIEDGADILWWPLVLWRQNWKNAFCRQLVPIGYSDFDYAEPIIIGDRDKLLTDAISAIEKFGGYDQISISGMKEFAGSEKELQFCPVCDLREYCSGEDFLKQAKKSLREDIRRQFNRINETGNLRFENCCQEEALKELPDFLDAHRMRWPNAYKAPDFHKNLIINGIKSGTLRFDRLRLNNVTIAWHLGFHYNKHFYYYMPANRIEYQKYSPGKLLLYKLVERSIAEDDVIFDHLRGDENYKSGWTNQIQGLWQLNKRRKSLCGIAKFFWLDKIKAKLT